MNCKICKFSKKSSSGEWLCFVDGFGVIIDIVKNELPEKRPIWCPLEESQFSNVKKEVKK